MNDSQFITMMALGALALGIATAPAAAQSVDEVIVTGSYIKHTPEDAPVPVDVVDSEELFNIGSPSVVELVKTLGVSSGVDGETNQFTSNGLEGTANINLRGLGAGRNLVLLNGRRNVWSPGPIAEQEQLFVDINMIPAAAIGRVELLKDGAAATYGSDAISGVVNFITRNDFEGFEVAISHKEIDDSDGDQDFGVIWGHDFGKTHIMASIGYNKRSKLRAIDRDWAVQPYFNRGNNKGYTGIPNPGSFGLVESDGDGGLRRRSPIQRANLASTTNIDESVNYVQYAVTQMGEGDAATFTYNMENDELVRVGNVGGHTLLQAIEDDPATEEVESGFREPTATELFNMGYTPAGEGYDNLVLTPDNPDTMTTNEALNRVASSGLARDPQCTNFAGAASVDNPLAPRANCTYNYVNYDNLIEEEERYNFFATLTHEFDEDMRFFAEVLWGENEVPEWNTSPSYPPQVLVDTNVDTGRIIPSYHPGLLAFVERYGELGPYTSIIAGDTAESDRVTGISGDPSHPSVQPGIVDTLGEAADADCTVTGRDDPSCAALIFFGRPFGISGPPNVGSREYETIKLTVGLEGTFDNGVDYVTSLLWSEAERIGRTNDTYIERWSLALRGFGGQTCPAGETVPGRGDCEYYNPFSNSIEVPQYKFAQISENPDYAAAIAFNGNDEKGIVNSRELREWLQFGLGTEITSELVVWEGVLSGEAENGVGWAFGAQYREEEYTLDPFEGNDLTINPCITDAENVRWRALNNLSALCDRGTTTGDDATDDDYEGSGQFGFLAGATPFDDDQDIFALFGELAIPFTDNLEMQISVRYEDYGGSVGDTIDPKVAVRYQATDNIVLRASASSTFRGPTLNQLGGRRTSLSFVPPTFSFKAIDTFGNPDLEPESAITSNIGALFDYDNVWNDSDNVSFGIDYWRFDFEDPIIKESFNDIVNNAFSGTGGMYNSGAAFAERITCTGGCEGKRASATERVRVNMINGPDIETDGFDVKAGYGLPIGEGQLDLTAQLTYITSYDIGASELNAPFDGLGKLNDDISYLRSLVEDKWKFGAKYAIGPHTLNGLINYTGEYEDNPSSAGPRDIDSHTTLDLHYNLSLEGFGDRLAESAVWVSIYNVTDEDPPFARLDLNYDPYTHNPFGQIVKVGIRHKF